MNKQIKCIIFDLGGVLLNEDHDPCRSEEFLNFFGITYEQFRIGWQAAWPKNRTGEVSEDIFWEEVLTKSEAKVIDVPKAKELWRKYVADIEGMLELVNELKPKYRLAILSNIGKEQLEFKAEKYNLENLFEVIVGSGVVGIGKPHKEVYELVLKKLGVTPEECVFIDDKEKNITPAKEMGIHTILFKSKENLLNDLKNIL